jgi:hypothetical protein
MRENCQYSAPQKAPLRWPADLVGPYPHLLASFGWIVQYLDDNSLYTRGYYIS